MTASASGPLGEEARLLVEAAQEWAARTFPGTEQHLAGGPAGCQWCPVCRGAAALAAPDVAEKVAVAVTAAAGALAAFLAAFGPPADPGPAGPPPAGPPPARPWPDRASPEPTPPGPGHHEIPVD